MNDNWEVHASPFFSKAWCPKHHNQMTELQNGWFGNPVWWCAECQAVYELKFMKMRAWDQDAVNKQLAKTEAKKTTHPTPPTEGGTQEGEQ